MSVPNKFSMKFSAQSCNEAFARMVVASFAASLDPTIEELEEMKTAVSEAVTNCIIHAYHSDATKEIQMNGIAEDGKLTIEIIDEGAGIEDTELARTPLFTTKPDEERSGMGFTIMENFMDHFELVSTVGGGTKLTMMKRIASKKALFN
ncbi:anti-sigma F factor [Paenibacillus septentrionalis]|uniref:Anti-sigma F factor n=1 Tax=Paenibacillus septentrionalis TaxID=429342 RepID=A0ABW1V1M0_9BACL